MIKSKKQMLIVIGVFALVMSLGTFSYAFFNYTRNGSANTISTGRIFFSTSQETINLINAFPISRNEALTDTDNTDEAIITITGDTNYSEGIEYLITVDDAHLSLEDSYKLVPIGIIVTPEKEGDLGEEASDYWTQRGGNQSYYSTVARDSVYYSGEPLFVGYIKPDTNGINGTIGIKTFIDKNKVAISDTYSPVFRNGENGWGWYVTDENGTTSEWVDGRTILTTTEWNSLATNPISFKIKVEANDGTWVKNTRVFESSSIKDNDLRSYVYESSTYNQYSLQILFRNGNLTINFAISFLERDEVLMPGDYAINFSDLDGYYIDFGEEEVFDKYVLTIMPEDCNNVIDEPIVFEIDNYNPITRRYDLSKIDLEELKQFVIDYNNIMNP